MSSYRIFNALLPYPMADTGNLDDVNLVMQPLDDGQVWCCPNNWARGEIMLAECGQIIARGKLPSENNALKDIYFTGDGRHC